MNLEDLNSSQRKAVTFDGKHLLVLAGAGTGKTKTIISRATYLISEGVNPGKIQILTFTKRAASEIITRVKASLAGNQASSLRGSTFHSWCNQLLTNYPNLFGTTSFTVIDSDDQVSMMKMICGKNNLVYEDVRIKPQGLIDLYSFARNTKRNLTDTIRYQYFNNYSSPEIDKQIQVIKPKLEVFLRQYEENKQRRRYLDYDDMLTVVANRLQNDEQARKIIGAKYEHIMVDEMQDTNPLQWDLLNPLQEICHLFCVGDDAQSIYSFRGADFKNVHSFQERVKDSEVYKLEENYRSTQEILDLPNWLLEKSPIDYNKTLSAVRGNGKKPVILNMDNEWEEANWIADKIIENYTKKDKTYSDHLILSRSLYYSIKLQAVFTQKKIPYVTYGGRKFMESAHIKDVISALRVVNNMEDEIAWVRFLMLWEGIGEVKASQYIHEILKLKDINKCVEWLESLILPDEPMQVSDILRGIVNNRGDVKEALRHASRGMTHRMKKIYAKDWEEKRKNDFPVLAVLASNYSTLGEFITELTLDNSTQVNNSPTLQVSKIDPSETKDLVILSTIHSAKGLEADSCFVLNVSPSAFPSSRSFGNLEEIEEERRVLYVALTRAKNELFITRSLHSTYSENSGSPLTEDGTLTIEERYFLNSLPEELADQMVVESEFKRVRDIATPNEIDTAIGIDFS